LALILEDSDRSSDYVGSSGAGGGDPADSSIYTPPLQSNYWPILLAVVGYFWLM